MDHPQIASHVNNIFESFGLLIASHPEIAAAAFGLLQAIIASQDATKK